MLKNNEAHAVDTIAYAVRSAREALLRHGGGRWQAVWRKKAVGGGNKRKSNSKERPRK